MHGIAEEPVIVSSTPRQWRVSEFTFTAREKYSYPPLGVRLTAIFRGPGGVVFRVPGFWDGGRVWKVRFTPNRPGEWTYETGAVEEDVIVADTLYDSGVVHGGEAPRRVDLDIRGAGEICLLVDDAGDGIAYDHADWADACFVDAGGRATYLDAMKPASARQGYKKLGLRANLSGGELRIGERTFEHGLGAHAASEIRYRVPAEAVRFQAWVGVDAVANDHGSVRFRVVRLQTVAGRPGKPVSGLHGQRGTFTVNPAAGNNPLFRHGGILKVSPDHRYLTYTDGTPFFWLGDTCWFCPSDLMPIDGSSNPEIPSAYKHFIRTRQRQGFSVIHMDFLGRIRGAGAFEDFHRTRTVDPEYWRTVDRYIAVANDAGIVPVVGMGWSGRPLGPDEWRLLWRYVAARYGACSVSWLICGEYNVRHVSDQKIGETLRLGAFIKNIDPWKRAMTIHPWYFRGDRRQAWKESWYDFIMLQGGHGEPPPLDVYYDAWKREPIRPVLEGECAYEGIHSFTAADVRNRAWRAIQSGCFGYTYGSHGLWYPTQNEKDNRFSEWGKPTPWWIALRRPGAEQMGRMRAIYESVRWWRLRPLPRAISVDAYSAGSKGLRIVYDCAAHFDSAESANALWCKVFRHSWVVQDLPEIELHPKNGLPATLTFRDVRLPETGPEETVRMIVALGMDPHTNLNDPKYPADGVTYVVRIGEDVLLREHRKSKQWAYRSLDLTKFAGRSVTLVLQTEAGENSFWDHARFRAPVVLRVDRRNRTPWRSLYTGPVPQPILVKHDGADVFVLYFPEENRSNEPDCRLRGLAGGAVYRAVWRDPRTAAARPLGEIRVADNASSAALPRPPDSQDWVLILRRVEE